MATVTSEQQGHKPHVYISVLNWNNYEQTINCLRQLEKIDYEPATIIVVDNASPNDSAARIREAFPQVRLIEARENLGYAAGHRLTVDIAMAEGGDLVWLINTDIAFDADALVHLVEAYEDFGNAIYGSAVVNIAAPDNLAFSPYVLRDGMNPDLGRRQFSHGTPFRSAFPNDSPWQVANVSGSSMMVPLEVIKRYGFMREDFFMYWEEVEYCFRLGMCGVKTFVVPCSRVMHEGGGSACKLPKTEAILSYYLFRNGLFMRRKYMGLLNSIQLIWSKRNFRMWLRLWLISIRHMEIIDSDIVLFRQYMRWMAIKDFLLNRTGKVYSPDGL